MALQSITEQHVKNILSEVCDPEIPVLTIEDLGIIRSVGVENNKVNIVITPTYSGCPAMTMIEVEMRTALLAAGIEDFEIKTELFPPWTTDAISENGKVKLEAYGIAPPMHSTSKMAMMGAETDIKCPLCGSIHTEVVSRYGSTACKALHRCLDCKEPFDYFKCI